MSFRSRTVFLLFSLPFLLFLNAGSFAKTRTGTPETAVRNALHEQVKAWNAGNLEKAMSFYLNSPKLLWISKAGTSKGYQPVLEAYKTEFADTSKMGIYSIEPLQLEKLSGKVVLYVVRWKIELAGEKRMGGVSTQIWKKINGNWVITAEHAS